MRFASGHLIGPYEVGAPLGAGAMGEVYRARDTRLGRDVALKFLPASFAADPDRLSRFEREAKTLAALNHPHIAQIHAIETIGSTHAIVMELVPGQTLAEMLATNGALAPRDALDIAAQIAEALEAAHEAGIVHRDLKPANIKVRSDGIVKVLDFGLAKGVIAGGGDALNSPTFTTPAMTAEGVILGTAAYMSPEQARGKPVDKRTDIWAFGCVLYEMLTGRVPFAGETVTDVIAAVVHHDPDWTALPASTPPVIRALLARCLQKDPRVRLRDVGDARLEIVDAKRFDPAAPPAGTPAKRRLPLSIGLAAVAFLVGAIAASSWRAAAPARGQVHWSGVLVGGPASIFQPVVSPDGQLLAFQTLVNGQTQIGVMQPDTGTWRVLTTDRTRGLAFTHTWSADGSRIFFDRATDTLNGVFSVPALGGPERLVIADAGFPVALPNGDLLIQRINADRNLQMHRFMPSTGAVEPLPAFPDPTVSDDIVVVSRDGRRAYFWGRRPDDLSAPSAFYGLDLDARQVERLASGLQLRAPVSIARDAGTDSILVGGLEGDVFQIVRVGAGRNPTIEPLLSLTAPATFDMDRNGDLFVAIRARQAEVLTFPPPSAADRVPQRLLTLPSMNFREAQTIAPFRDGSLLVASRSGEHDRLLVVRAGREPSPLLDGGEDTRPPAAALGSSQALVMIGPRSAQDLAIVDTAEGRIVRRVKAPAENMLTMDASPDGRTIYYTAGGSVWSVSIDGGSPRKLGPGDSLTIAPDTGDLIVKLDEAARFRLVKMNKETGAVEEITLKGDLRLIQRPLAPGAARQGKLLLGMATVDSWFWHGATVDLRTGVTAKLAGVNPTDVHFATWRADGVPVAFGYGIDTSLWRFTPRK